MFKVFDIHAPVLINTIGHSIGLLLFACFLFLVLRDRPAAHRRGQISLPAVAATLALLWNLGSLAALASVSGLLPSSDLAAALSFSVLSLLPAVLLHLSLERKLRAIWLTGYGCSVLAVGLHLSELLWPDIPLHEAALWVIIVGFGILTAAAMFLAGRGSQTRRDSIGRRIPVSMCLFLFAISFLHFSPGHERNAWSSEVAIHHAGLPLALYVLLQDYRFLMLDAFLRFVVNSVVAVGFVLFTLLLDSKFHFVSRVDGNSFLTGMLLVAACGSLVLLVVARGTLQSLLTKVVFHRKDREPYVRAIREAGSAAENEKSFIEATAPIFADFAGTKHSLLREISSWEQARLPIEPTLILEPNRHVINGLPEDETLEACVPVRFMSGDGALILLGRREGGRRYLSEDLQELERLAAVVVEQVERLRNSEIQRLVSQAELRALQAQINPHFLFNSLNTLYGTIPREIAEARRMVLNLADIFRYFLQSNRTLVPLSEELELIRAYLQIESARLGDRLSTEIDVDEAAARVSIPILSVQPLIENAVKHGVAARSLPGTVRLFARSVEDGIEIRVSDDGPGFQSGMDRKNNAGGGVGLENVRQRLHLCFGDVARFTIKTSASGTTISFLVPNRRSPQSVLEKIPA